MTDTKHAGLSAALERVLRQHRLAVCLLCALLGWLGAGASGAHAAELSWAYGKLFGPASSAEGTILDTRVPAQKFGEAMRTAGYDSRWDLDGHAAIDAWEEGAQSSVLGLFGHANEQVFVLDDPLPGTNLYATGQLHWANLRYDFVNPRYNASWRAWTPALADDILIAVLGGCSTAKDDPTGVDFFYTAWELGIDSVVGYRDLIYGNVDMSDTGGNYYWTRFATYAGAGYTLRDALSQAAADLYAREAQYLGYDQWAVGGTIAAPENSRFSPARAGVVPTGYPLQKRPRPSAIVDSEFNLAGLTTAATYPVTTDSGSYTDVETAEGVSVRYGADGMMVRLIAPLSVGEPVVVTEADARSRALDFASSRLPWFDAQQSILVRDQRVSHVDGDTVASFTWRSAIAGIPGPDAVTAEVDRQTGGIVFFAADRTTPSTLLRLVSRDAAIDAARRAIGSANAPVESAAQDVWDRPRWIVTLDHGPSQLGTAAKSQVVVDGSSGQVVSISNTA